MIGLAGASLVFVLFDLQYPARPAVVLAFATLCPGMALVRLLRLDRAWIELFLAIVVSLAFAAVVATVLIYGGSWNPTIGLLILVGVTLAAVLANLLRPEI